MAQRNSLSEAVALLSAKRSEKESSKMIVGFNKLCIEKHKLEETRDKPRERKKTVSQRVLKATA